MAKAYSRLSWLALCALLLAACQSTSTPVPAGTASVHGTPLPATNLSPDWQQLERPLQIPTVAPGQACPVTPLQDIAPQAFAPGAGRGLIYAVGTVGTLPVGGTTTGYHKILWVARKTYSGPVLVRGWQIDGSKVLTFIHNGGTAEAEMRLDRSEASSPNADDWRQWPSLTIVPGVGCYAYQVDGETFTDVIVFAVLP